MNELTSYEKSFMLVSLLFARKKLDEILHFLPEKSQKNIEDKSKEFLAMPQKDRVTKVIYELKKLLSLDEKNYSLISNTDIDIALLKEPTYLREILKKLVLTKDSKDVPHARLIKQCFYQQFF